MSEILKGAIGIKIDPKSVGLNNVDGNVVDNYNWCLNNGKKDDVPVIAMWEYQQTTSSLYNSIAYWTYGTIDRNVGKNGEVFSIGSDSYKNLYLASETGQTFRFPYYDEYHHQITNSWGESRGLDAIPATANLIGKVADIAKMGFPAGGIEFQKAWEGTDSGQYAFSFHLLNTINDSKIKNKALVDRLIASNLQYKINVIAAYPPCIYRVLIPGIRYSPASVISNLTINNIGQINRIDGISYPDAYRITIGIRELVVESRQIFSDTWGSKVKAINALGDKDNENTQQKVSTEIKNSKTPEQK